jgi:hypothetical protein
LTLERLLGYERFSSEAKITYIKLNRQMRCPPRGTVPVNTRMRYKLFTHNIQFAFGHGGDHSSYVSRFLPTSFAIRNVF